MSTNSLFKKIGSLLLICMIVVGILTPVTAFAAAPTITASSSNVTSNSFTMNSNITANNGINIRSTFFYITDKTGNTSTAKSMGNKTPINANDRTNSYTINNLTAGTYKFQAVSVNVNGEAGYSSWVTVNIVAMPTTITWNYNGGTGSPASSNLTAGAAFGTLPTPNSRTGFSFTGWFNTSAATGGTQITSSSIVPSANTTYWARWTATPTTITLYNGTTAISANISQGGSYSVTVPQNSDLWVGATPGIDLVTSLNQASFTDSDHSSSVVGDNLIYGGTRVTATTGTKTVYVALYSNASGRAYSSSYVIATFTITVASNNTVPSAITNLSATAGTGQITLGWTAPSNGGSAITRYEYRQRTGTTGTWGSWTSTGSTSTSYTRTGLTEGTTYNFQVRAVNAIGYAPDSNIVSATPVTTQPVSINISVQQNTGNGNIRVGGTYRWADTVTINVRNLSTNTVIENQACHVDGSNWYYDKPVEAGVSYRFAVKGTKGNDIQWAEVEVIAAGSSVNAALRDALDRADKLRAYRFTPQNIITDGNRTFAAGTTYQGFPYTMNRTLTPSYNLTYQGGRPTTYQGFDCSQYISYVLGYGGTGYITQTFNEKAYSTTDDRLFVVDNSGDVRVGDVFSYGPSGAAGHVVIISRVYQEGSTWYVEYMNQQGTPMMDIDTRVTGCTIKRRDTLSNFWNSYITSKATYSDRTANGHHLRVRAFYP